MIPNHAGWPLPYFQTKAVRAGFEPARGLVNSQVPYQLGYRTTNSRRRACADCACTDCACRRQSGGRRNRTAAYYALCANALRVLTYEISALPSKLFRQKRARGENRTHDLSFTEAVRRLLRFAGMVGRVGVEPTTPRLKVENSS